MEYVRKYRVREVHTNAGEVQFFPETHMGGEMFWSSVGYRAFYWTLEEARQTIERYKVENPYGVQKEVIHEI